MKMFYKTACKDWIDGLPIGNGRLAAMVVQDQDCDRFYFNHEWLWRGTEEARNRHADQTAQHLPEIRALLAEGNVREGSVRANNFFGGGGTRAGQYYPEDYAGRTAHPPRLDNYQPAGTLIASFNQDQTLQERTLNLTDGMVTEQRKTASEPILATHYADCHSDLLSFLWTSKTPFGITFTYERATDANADTSFTIDGSVLRYRCQFHGGQKYVVQMTVETDGTLLPKQEALIVKNATSIRIITDIGVEETGYEEELKRHPIPTDWESSFKQHQKRFSQIMESVSFELEPDSKLEQMPLEERLAGLKAGRRDDGLVALYFQYGRYLLLASCICGDLPANLQGKWNRDILPAWNCDYHLDINLQMNYWAAESAGLSDCVLPLVKWLQRIQKNGREAAKNLYGCRGFYLPLSSDAWASTSPEAWGYGVWIGGAAWMGEHLWSHYRYSGDQTFLKEVAYPYFAELCDFYEDYMTVDQDGKMKISPSQSPEHFFPEVSDLYIVGICENSAMDVQLAYNTFRYAIAGAKALGVDADKVEKWQKMQDALPDFKIGSDGRLLEWGEEREEWEPTHRHLSHLYGAYPSDLFTPKTRPKQYQACIKSLAVRTDRTSTSGGWGQAWASCMWARFGCADKFYDGFFGLLRDYTSKSFLDLHVNPFEQIEGTHVFQIDGNFGAIAAVMEALCGYFDREVHLLRALPDSWNKGALRGIRVPGGHVIDLAWENGAVTALKVCIGYEKTVSFCFPDGKQMTVSGNVGEEKTIL